MRRLTGLYLILPMLWFGTVEGHQITRGPYLQDAGQDRMTIVYQSDHTEEGVLRYGRFPGPPWEHEQVQAPDDEQVFRLSGLLPDTRYYYEVEVGGYLTVSGPDYTFTTYPPTGSRRPFRFLAWGDSGTGNQPQFDVAGNMDRLSPRPALGLGIGDLVYPHGEWFLYDPHYFTPYARLLRNMVIWPAMGNHDAIPFFGIPWMDAFFLPEDTGAPGHPSGTELYYSFDYGMAHFVCLDSQMSDRSRQGPMFAWLMDDLAAARAGGARWIFVFFHHPPYTRGTHDSYDPGDSGGRLKDMHDDLLPALEAAGVDLVLTGHSHVYERSYLLMNDIVLQPHPDSYSKIATRDGTIYIVSGVGGHAGSGPLDHPLMAYTLADTPGNTVIDVGYDTLRGTFLTQSGAHVDLFTLTKASQDTDPPRIAEVVSQGTHLGELKIAFDEPVQPGTGPAGAERPGNYQITPALSVSQARLLSDGRTVLLTTDAHALGTGYTLRVEGVEDLAGNRVVPEREWGYHPRARFGVDPNAAWRYFEGRTAPPTDWMDPGFNDSGWPVGEAGFGYGDQDDQTVLNMQNQYLTLYARRSFTVPDPTTATAIYLDILYDDGFVAFLNGQEVVRENVPFGQGHLTPAPDSHNAEELERFDLSHLQGVLRPGTNVLAVEGHNRNIDSGDFTLHPRLRIEGGIASGQAPVAIIDGLEGGNAPFTVTLSGERSGVPGGSISQHRWNLGDGTTAQGERITHTYFQPGIYPVHLVVSDGQGTQRVAGTTIHVHAQGSAPVAAATAGPLDPQPGDVVQFGRVASSDPDGGATYLLWDFGDPQSGPDNVSSDPHPTHVYTHPGTYEARLIVVDDEGSRAVATVTIQVGGSGASGSSGSTSGSPSSNTGTTKNGGGAQRKRGGSRGCQVDHRPGAGWVSLLLLVLLLGPVRRRQPSKPER